MENIGGFSEADFKLMSECVRILLRAGDGASKVTSDVAENIDWDAHGILLNDEAEKIVAAGVFLSKSRGIGVLGSNDGAWFLSGGGYKEKAREKRKAESFEARAKRKNKRDDELVPIVLGFLETRNSGVGLDSLRRDVGASQPTVKRVLLRLQSENKVKSERAGKCVLWSLVREHSASTTSTTMTE